MSAFKRGFIVCVEVELMGTHRAVFEHFVIGVDPEILAQLISVAPSFSLRNSCAEWRRKFRTQRRQMDSRIAQIVSAVLGHWMLVVAACVSSACVTAGIWKAG
jgi:hypothetical protein